MAQAANRSRTLQQRAIDGQNRVSAVADVDAAFRESVAAHEGVAAQSEGSHLSREEAHCEGRNGLCGVENVANGAKIELCAVGAEGKLAKKERIGEVGALEVGGVVARDEEEPETGVGDEGERREVNAAAAAVE